MDSQRRHYQRLTSSIKLCLSDSGEDMPNDIFYNILSYSYFTHYKRNKDNVTKDAIPENNASQNVDSTFVSNRSKKILRSDEPKIQNIEILAALVSKEERFKPVVTEMILKQHVIKRVKTITISADKIDPPLVESEFMSTQDGIQFKSPTKTKIDEKFVVNLYESRVLNTSSIVKQAIKGDFVQMDSELHIKEQQCDEALGFQQETDTASSFSISNLTQLIEWSKTATPISADSNSWTSEDSDLIEQMHKECQIIKEASKAVKICNSTNKFINGTEQLEVERILLLAEVKRSLLIQEFSQNSELSIKPEGARLEISNLQFPLVLSNVNGYRVWFVVTCSTESMLQASPLIEMTKRDNVLEIPESFTFSKLQPTSVIKIKVYHVKIRHTKRLRLSKLACIKKTKASRITRELHYKDLLTGAERRDDIFSSLFNLCGSLDVTVAELITKDKFIVNCPSGVLHGMVTTSSQLFNTPPHHEDCVGFVTLGKELASGAIVWDRKWCRFEDTILQFWNYPSEEGINEPKLVLNLQHCVQDAIDVARCYPKRSLMIEIASSSDENIVLTKYYLNLDSKQDLKFWKGCLNSIVLYRRLWEHLMK